MVVGAFPIAKLGTLLLRQISKPLANFVKERAKKSPFFRTYICMPPAQFYNWCEVKAKMWIMDLGKPTTVPTLNEAMAIELGANLLGEGIIFVVAAGVLLLEYQRQSRKETAKEKQRQDEIDTLSFTIQELYFNTEKQDAQIRELHRMIMDLQSSVVQKPWRNPKPISEKIIPPPCPPQPKNPSQGDSKIPEENPKNPTLPSGQPCVPESKNERQLGVFLRALDYIETEVKGER